MKVTKVTYSKRNTKGESVTLDVELEDGDSAQEALRRARATAKIALGELPSTRDVTKLSELMHSKADELGKIATGLQREVFA